MFSLSLLFKPFWRSDILNKENKLPKIVFWGKPDFILSVGIKLLLSLGPMY